MFNKEKRQEKRERREAVKAELEKQIKPRQTFGQIKESRERRDDRLGDSNEREVVVRDRLHALHAGQTDDTIANIGSELLYLSALSNMHVQIHDQLSKPTKCFTRWTVFGRHDKDFLGMAPTNREVSFGGVTVSFMEKGKTTITQEVHYWDMVALLQQIQAA